MLGRRIWAGIVIPFNLFKIFQISLSFLLINIAWLYDDLSRRIHPHNNKETPMPNVKVLIGFLCLFSGYVAAASPKLGL